MNTSVNMAVLNGNKATPRYISRTEGMYENRCQMVVIGKLIKEGKVALHLIDGRIFVDGDELARAIDVYRTRGINNDLFR